MCEYNQLPGTIFFIPIASLFKRHQRSAWDDAQRRTGSCLKTGQRFIFVIIYLLLPIKCIIFDSVSKILFNFLLPIMIIMILIMKILLHNVHKIIILRHPTYVYQFIIFLIITKIECWPLFKQDPDDVPFFPSRPRPCRRSWRILWATTRWRSHRQSDCSRCTRTWSQRGWCWGGGGPSTVLPKGRKCYKTTKL